MPPARSSPADAFVAHCSPDSLWLNRVHRQQGRRRESGIAETELVRYEIRCVAIVGPMDAGTVRPRTRVVDRDRARGHAHDLRPTRRSATAGAMRARADDLNHVAGSPRMVLRADEVRARIGDVRPRSPGEA